LVPSRAFASSSSVVPVTTKSGPQTSKLARDRPLLANPRSSAGIVTSRT